jgi:hypothetical protein
MLFILLLLTQMVVLGELHVFLKSTWIGLFGKKMSLSQPWKLWFAASFPDKKKLNSLMETMFYVIRLLTQMVFFRKIHVFLQLSWISLVGAHRSYPHLETSKLLEVFLSKLTQFFRGNKVLDKILLKVMVFFGEIHVFLQIRWLCLFGTKWDFLQFEKYDFQEVILSKTISILIGQQCATYSCF